ncbi:MAG TPA: acyltransferase [Steroidobacteraceae bacterium]|jgi:peptidoglycan/LPS O-acetylase OafA/YrhL
MGLLRTVFALAVVLTHTWPTGLVFVGGENAVQCFYIISGFLISYILVEKKSYPTLWAFYLNRYLRLYPIYLFVAILSLIAILATRHAEFFRVYQEAPASAIALLAFSNTFLFGQDWIMFCGVRDHELVPVTNFMNSDVPLFWGQVIHPSWTLGVELSFYLIAPFVLVRRKLIYALLALSLCLRLYLIHLGLGTRDPWTYRFFPTELALFLFGALAHQLLLPMYRKLEAGRRVRAANLATWSLVAFSLVYFLIPVEDIYKRLFLLTVFVGLVPLTFVFQQTHRFDSWIGNLSYPIYIGHMLVLWGASYLLKHLGLDGPRAISLLCVAGSIAFAIFLNWFVGDRVESLRSRLRSRGEGVRSVDWRRWWTRRGPAVQKVGST